MALDDNGFDIGVVGIPIFGGVWLADESDTTKIDKADLIDVTFSPSEASWNKAPLRTEDGGGTWTLEKDGDDIVFFEEGYSIPSGLANATFVFTAAGYTALVQKLQSGSKPDSDGYLVVDAGGSGNSYRFFWKENYRNGSVIHRSGTCSASVAETQATRGEVKGYEVTLTVKYQVGLGGKAGGHFEQAALVPVDES